MDQQTIISLLSEVKDPEIPVLTISDLGILRHVEYSDDLVTIEITPTYSGCPAMETIKEDIQHVLQQHGLHKIDIKQVLSPAWTTDWMSESGKEKLKEYGIAAPATHLCSHNGEDQPEHCPLCNSMHVELISRFGSTACKALYRCLDCQEPFDYFKCH